MHCKNDRCHYPITGVEDFLKGKQNVTRMEAAEVELKAESLPSATRIIVLRPAL
jgi:hypothetical protein